MHWRTACGVGLATVLSLSSNARADDSQFTLVRDTYTHSAWYKFWQFQWQPQNWTSPIDYSRGTTYLRYDVKSLNEPAGLTFCYFQDQHISSKHACTSELKVSQPGVYYVKQDNGTIWQRSGIDWTRPLLDFMVIDNLSKGVAKTLLTVEFIVVAPGARLAAPDDWSCPDAWNCTDGSGGGTGGTSGTGGSASGGTNSGGTSSGGTSSGGASSGGTSSGGASSGGESSGGTSSGGTSTGGASGGGFSSGGESSGGALGTGGTSSSGGEGSAPSEPEPSATGGSEGTPEPSDDDDDDGTVTSGSRFDARDDSGGCAWTGRAGVPGLGWIGLAGFGWVVVRRRVRRALHSENNG